MKFATATVAILAAAPAALAWGGKAHAAIGAIAASFLDKPGAKLVADLLRGSSLETVAIWADTVKRTSKYSYTRVLHYADSNDNPPSSCSYDDNHGCADGKCIVGAIGNFTHVASCASSALADDKDDALKFLAHFLGDITQPLHICSRGRGGNDQKVRFGGRKSVAFHSIWDTQMPDKRIKEDHGNSVDTYVSFLVQQIRSGAYKNVAASWISAHGVTDRNKNGNSLAAIDWATDSNSFDCTVVWPSYDADPDQDFAADYYTNSVPTIDLQIAKGGYVLGNWVNQIAATCNSAQRRRPRQ
ncbi:hypothetical protein BASA50_008262 [Batrachochytrium salamandrivorans]|uniref:Uncharacterized protein n=1 Tax=Batrachochytrium salamandrivorans TaxID=1357716 RepID=A0ABQ8F5U1_9FUNG|nr:hypothetical protein BASA60_007642 [Batrachochytrium salamandrivorans]KAH6592117.1 hypothetical protein BASA50_008262 [Batrachochytrium salamandrivorans]KAH9269848.1 hypothetical protein BASA83_007996 [Batrachochytrium salamandrivorans]KAJ1342272.1 hypothetical protein BSLG_003195 [Batrachochytrium salamandrivorans]